MANENGLERLKSAKNHKINNDIEREKPTMREVAVALSQTKDWKMAAIERRKKQKT